MHRVAVTHKVLLNAGLRIKTQYLVKELTQNEFSKMVTSVDAFVKKKIIFRLRIPVFNIKYEIARIYFNIINIIANYTFNTGYGFTIYFDYMLYSNIEDPPPPVNDDWDIIVWQPDLNIPDDGAYDALSITSKVDGASLADAFTVSFVWLGNGRPGPQSFEVYQEEPFNILESGQTVPIQPGDVSGNGAVTAYDAALVLQIVVGLINELPLAAIGDVSGNDITAYDAALILQYTVGLITQFPVETKTAAPVLDAKSEKDALMKAIAQLETTTLNKEQKQVLEQLKHFVSKRLLPKHTVLLQNFPNPFNPETWIPYALAESAVVTIHIYNAQGHLIRSLTPGFRPAGIYTTLATATYWDGRNQSGESVSSGLYYNTIHAGDFTATRKMLVVK